MAEAGVAQGRRRQFLLRLRVAQYLPLPLLTLPAFANDAGSALAGLERRNGGRLGVAVLDTASGRSSGHRSDERFPLTSTFKFLAAALVLARVDRGQEQLDRRIVFSDKDLVTYSPVTKDHVGPAGMSVADICAAAVTLSDNTAGNLMLASFGGPAALTAYARSLGDGLTRLDRIETALNEAAPGDPRDTTTPNAMLGDMQRLLVGDALSAESRQHLTQWLLASKTGDETPTRRPAVRLAGGRQDRRRRQRNGQRHCRCLAAGACADPDRGLFHRLDDRRRRAQRGDRRRGSDRGRQPLNRCR